MKKKNALRVLLVLMGFIPVTATVGQAFQQNVNNPVFSVSPLKGDFGGIQLGSAGTIDFTIKNSGTSVLKIKSVEIDGAGFTLADTNSYPFEVIADTGFAYPDGNSGKTLKFRVTFSPATSGAKTGRVLVTYGLYSDQVHEIMLTGEGVSCQEATEAVKGENHATRQNVWYKYTADKFSIVEVNACHPNQVNSPTNPYRLLYFYVYDGCNGRLIPEKEEWTGLCTYDHEAVPVSMIRRAGETIYIYWPMVNPDSPYAKNGFYFNINVTYPTDGDVCENAIPLILPVINHFGTTTGFNKDYVYSPCSPFTNYFGGNDKVYTVTLPSEGYLTGDILGAYGSIHVLDACPNEELSREHCRAFAGGPNGGHFRKKMDAGTYYVIISNWSPPTSLDYLLNMSWEGVSGIDGGELINSLAVYPNPAADRFSVEITQDVPADLTLELVSIRGQLMYKKEAKGVYTLHEEINANGFAPGVYLLKVNTGRELKIRKVVLE